MGFCFISLQTFIIGYRCMLAFFFKWHEVSEIFHMLFNCSKVNGINNIKDLMQCCRKEEERCATIISRKWILMSSYSVILRNKIVAGHVGWMCRFTTWIFAKRHVGSYMRKTDRHVHPQNTRTCWIEGCGLHPQFVLCQSLQKVAVGKHMSFSHTLVSCSSNSRSDAVISRVGLFS